VTADQIALFGPGAELPGETIVNAVAFIDPSRLMPDDRIQVEAVFTYTEFNDKTGEYRGHRGRFTSGIDERLAHDPHAVAGAITVDLVRWVKAAGVPLGSCRGERHTHTSPDGLVMTFEFDHDRKKR